MSFQDFVDRHGLTFPQISDDRGAVYAHFGVPIQPALVLISADGAVETLFGAVDERSLETALSELTSA